MRVSLRARIQKSTKPKGRFMRRPRHRALPLTTIGFLAGWLAALAVPAPVRAASHDCRMLNVPGVATGINNAGVIVGSGGGHGFIRDTAGNDTTVDFPGQANTQLLAIN